MYPDISIVVPHPSCPCPALTHPFALLVGNVDWARPFHLDLMLTIPDVIGLPSLYCCGASVELYLVLPI